MNICISKTDGFEVKKVGDKYLMFIDGQQYMAYDTKHEHEKHEIKAHVDLAYGNVIATGLGFGIRERLLLQKPSVKSLTVVELNSSVIDYHNMLNESWFRDPKLTIVNEDALEFKGECDCLLIDHFEDPFTNTKTEGWLAQCEIIQAHIKSNITWIWPLEMMIAISYKPPLITYNNIKQNFNLQLPDITEEQLLEYIKNFSASSFKG